MLSLLLGAPLLSLLWVSWQRSERWLLPTSLLGPGLGLSLTLWYIWQYIDGLTMPRLAIDWLTIIPWQLQFQLDGLVLLFLLLIYGIGCLVLFYARFYLSKPAELRKLQQLLLGFMLAMVGLVTSAHLIQMWFFWELTSLCSFLLVGFKSNYQAARRGARFALIITGSGGLALLAGLLLLGQLAGSYELTEVLAKAGEIQNSPGYLAALLLILVGAFSKSAQFPFHLWLPNAMAAPTPVSAYLHSATLVKAGIFVMLRLYPVLAGTDWWFSIVSLTGLTTLLVGAYFALFQHDIKGLLAYSTISHLGLITLLLGLDSPLACVAAIFHLINHAVFKASLFMAAGIIDHETGSRDMRKINGLWRYMPVTAALAMVSASAMAGVPLLNGFLSKEMFFTETLHQGVFGSFSWLLPAVATLAGVLSVAYSSRFVHDIFFNGEPVGLERTPHEPPRFMRVPMELLVALCIGIGLLPQWFVGDVLSLAAQAALQGPLPDYSLALWHGFNFPLLMSVLAFIGGLVLYSLRRQLFLFHAGFEPKAVLGLFEMAVAWGITQITKLRPWLQYQTLGSMLAVLWLWVLLWVVGPLATWQQPSILPEPLAFEPLMAMIMLCMMLCCGLVIYWHRQRLLALLMLSVIGLGVCFLFVRYSAPDLAITQLAVEIATAVLFLLGLYFLPERSTSLTSPPQFTRHLLIATAVGVVVGMLAYAMLTLEQGSVAGFFLSHAKTDGGGTNVVNVILVDFRGFDTFGEITVLAITALAIASLLRGMPRLKITKDGMGHPYTLAPQSLLLRVMSGWVLPIALVLSAYLFFRGHNLPGGGFVAGLVTAIAIVLHYIAQGAEQVPVTWQRRYQWLLLLGLALATVTGVASWWFERPFLTSWFDYLTLPLIGTFELASAIAFDLGVYLTVVGSTLLMLMSLGLITTRRHPREGGL